MNAFGKRNGLGGAGQRPSFGVARPMKGGAQPSGGEQFPPVDDLDEEPESTGNDTASTAPATPVGAMDRLNDRQNASGAAASSKGEGFEASVHRIKEQVLPR